MAYDITSALKLINTQIVAAILAEPVEPGMSLTLVPKVGHSDTERIRLSMDKSFAVDIQTKFNYPKWSSYADGIKVVVETKSYDVRRSRDTFRILRHTATATDILAMAKLLVGFAVKEVKNRKERHALKLDAAARNAARVDTLNRLVPSMTFTKTSRTSEFRGNTKRGNVTVTDYDGPDVYVDFGIPYAKVDRAKLNDVLVRWQEFVNSL